jgi:two-component system sensor histidine kinase ArlS
MKRYGYPFVKIDRKVVSFNDGRYCVLPFEYKKVSNKKLLEEFYTEIFKNSSTNEIVSGVDPLGFTYLNLDFICYVGLVSEKKDRGKYNNLGKKYPLNKFDSIYLQKQIQFEYDLLNFKEFIPIEIVTQNLHELRGFNSKISNNIDRIMKIDNEMEWEQKFEEQSESIKKIYVGSRLIKFILDNIKFYIPNFFETLKMDYNRTFVVHRSVSKIVKIYRNDFKRDKADIDFRGYCSGKIAGDKEYFEILIKTLVENALKYSEFPKRIGPKVIISENTREIGIEVHSYGRAIPETEQPYLFSKGFRASINKKTQEGTGMGLFNAKQLAKHFKAKIEFKSEDVSKDNNIDLAWNIFTLTLNKTS